MFIEIIGVIAILMALRAVITKDRAEKLLYINYFSNNRKWDLNVGIY